MFTPSVFVDTTIPILTPILMRILTPLVVRCRMGPSVWLCSSGRQERDQGQSPAPSPSRARHIWAFSPAKPDTRGIVDAPSPIGIEWGHLDWFVSPLLSRRARKVAEGSLMKSSVACVVCGEDRGNWPRLDPLLGEPDT